jgi:hypothetical protein
MHPPRAQSIVRPAVREDEKEIWRMFKEHHAENAFFPLSIPKVQYYLDRVLKPETIPVDDNGPRGIVGVIGPIGNLQAAIMLVLGSPWYSDAITMDDCMSFVDKRYRCSNHAKALLEYSKHIVDQIRVTNPDFKMILGVLSNIRTAEKVRLYSRKMQPVGAYFMYPPPSGALPLTELYSKKA